MPFRLHLERVFARICRPTVSRTNRCIDTTGRRICDAREAVEVEKVTIEGVRNEPVRGAEIMEIEVAICC